MEKSDTMEIIHISKSFGSNVVLQDVSLQLIPGKCIAICGHNGCGKSTLLNAVAGFLRIDSGELQLKNAVLQYIPDHFFTTRMNARDFLMHMGAIQGMDADAALAVIWEYTHKFFMDDLLKTPMQYLSKGSLQKVAVIQALLQTPDILLMDEPLNGQDIASQRVFIELMEALKKKDVCILMAVHEQRLIKEVADIVYELHDGVLRLMTSLPVMEQVYVRFSRQQEEKKLVCAREESDACIQRYLMQGWHLEELRHENNL